MVNYQDGKIYKLIGNGLTYYGSTCNELHKRLWQHKNNFINYKGGGICSSKILFESGEVEIILVEKYSCNDKNELTSRERYYIENNDCVNKVIPTRTYKEWEEQNKDKLKEKKKEYREANKDKIKEYYDTNKDKLKEWREVNKYKMLEYKKKYRDNNKGKIKERQRLNRLYNKIDRIFKD
jgi:hypothetical protein